MVIMNQYTRRIIGFAVDAGNVDGPTLCRTFNDATSGQDWPQLISSDNDLLFQYHRWKGDLRVLEIEEVKSLPHVTISHSFVERLIGSVRRSYWIRPYFGQRQICRASCIVISTIKIRAGLILVGMEPLR